MKSLLLGVAVAGVLSANPVSAAKPTQTSTIILDTPAAYAASTATWTPRLGDWVTFTVGFPKALEASRVSIQILCYQNGGLMFATAGYFDRAFLLGGTSSPWLQSGGSATCHADLYYWSTNGQKFNQLAWTEFGADGF